MGYVVQLRKTSNRQFLRLVGDEVGNAALESSDSGLSADLEKIEALNGANLYSEFIKRHGHRPSREQASAIGRIMGARVRASDGTMQPGLTKGERAALASIKKRRKEWAKQVEHIRRTVVAISALSQNQDDPSAVMHYGVDVFSNPNLREQLDSALTWLIRFAEESHRNEKGSCAKGPKLVRCDHQRLAE
jgi:hypothetical protein